MRDEIFSLNCDRVKRNSCTDKCPVVGYRSQCSARVYRAHIARLADRSELRADKHAKRSFEALSR